MARSAHLGGRPDQTERPAGIDPRVPRFSQAMTGVLLLVVFLLAGLLPWVVWAVPVLAVILGAGAVFGPRFNLWGLVFRHVLMPVFKLGPPVKRKDGAPARFAMVLGTLFLGVASVLLLVGAGAALWVGWAFVLMVAALALLAAITNLCVGCEIYNFVLRWKSKPATANESEPASPRR